MTRLQVVRDAPAAETSASLVQGWQVHPSDCKEEPGGGVKLAVTHRGERHYYRLQPARGDDGSTLYFVSVLNGGPLPEWLGVLDSQGFRVPRGTPRSHASEVFDAYWRFWSTLAVEAA